MFIDEMKLLFDTCANERIVNVDQTAILVAQKQLRIGDRKGIDDVSIPVHFNEKQCITAVYPIVAEGFQFLKQFIAKGKSEQVLDNGWSYIQSQYDGNDEVHAILDPNKAHINQRDS